MTKLLALALALAGCGARSTQSSPPRDHCRFDAAPTVIRSDDKAVLKVWQVEARPVFATPALPEDAAFAEFRRVIRDARADLEHPIADRPASKTDEQTEIWRREDLNRDLAYGGRGGQIRPIQCLEALLFAEQNARYSELSQPTEFIANILRKDINGTPMFKIYFGASDVMFPPKAYYGFDEVRTDIAAGWEWLTVLHNHTVGTRGDQPALGVTVPSTSDVHLFKNLVEDGLRSARVTNGFYTIDVPASAFGLYATRE